MLYYYDYDDERPDDDWDEEKIEHFYQLWLFNKAVEKYDAEQWATLNPQTAPKVPHADLDAW